MAVDVCSEIASLVVSPRISFSHDLKETDDIIPNECHHFRSDAFLLESTIDFDFCLTNQIFTQEISSADELFSNGKILPVEVKKSTSNNNNIPIPRAVSAKGKVHADLSAISNEALRLFSIDSRLKKNSLDKKSTSIKEIKQSEPQSLPHKETKPAGAILENATNVDTKKKRLKEFLSNEETEEEEEKEKLPQAKPFWQFRRSSSLNCENGRSNGLIRSSFQFLSRSNSTGSAPTTKQSSSTLPKIFQKQNSQKEHIKVLRKSSSLSSSSSSSSSSFNHNHPLHSSSKRAQSHSHPLKKSYSRSYGNGVNVSPVLNLPPTYISKGTICLFGLGSLFCNGKSKKKK